MDGSEEGGGSLGWYEEAVILVLGWYSGSSWLEGQDSTSNERNILISKWD